MSEFVLAKLELDETAATIAAGREFISYAVEAIKSARTEIERMIRRDDFFLTTLEPYEPQTEVSRIIARMCDASRQANVGPMATVAGVIAQEAMEAMASHGCTHGWVDNGGDISLLTSSPVTVEVFSQPESKTAIGMELEPTNDILGICTSSGRLGHSISLGDTDATVIIAKDAVLGDALATAVGNLVKDSSSMKTCFDGFKSNPGLIGGLVLRDGEAAMYGKVPKIVDIEHNPDRVTAHSKMPLSKYTGNASVKSEAGT